jgi:predicted metal-dependent peptidase
MRKPIPEDQYLEIISSIEDYHKVFYSFVEMSDICFDDDVPTACVSFPKQGKPELTLGAKFWLELTLRERLFVICHECLHVILNHGIRNGMSVPGATPDLVNKAQDITINEMIVYLFGFNRNDIRDWQKYCWIDTCFKDPLIIKKNETFIYYLKELIKNPPPPSGDGPGQGGPSTLDEHSDPSVGSDGDPGEKQSKQNVAQTLAEELSVGEIEEILKSLPEACTGRGAMTRILEQLIEKKVQKQKLNFTKFIRKLKKTALKEVDTDVETFTHDDRRFNEVLMRRDIALPGKKSIGRPKKDRLLTAVFMDVSGSCIEHLPFFTKVVKAFEEEKQFFDLVMYVFDTKVRRVKWGDRPMVGGGTSFDIIERECLDLENEIGRYPDCVVVITDGDGNEVKPKAPTKWIWLLTPGATERYISSESRKYPISDIVL